MEVNALTYIRAGCTHNISVPSENFFYSHYHSCHLPETSRWSDLSVELILELFFLYTLVGHKIEKESKDSVNEEVAALVTTYSSVH